MSKSQRLNILIYVSYTVVERRKVKIVGIKSHQLGGWVTSVNIMINGFMNEVWSLQGLEIFLLATMTRPVFLLTQPLIQWVPGAFPRGIKQRGCEADHSHSSSAMIKKQWSYTSIPPYVVMVWHLLSTRDFTFYLSSCILLKDLNHL
jgi:hypothetical protein